MSVPVLLRRFMLGATAAAVSLCVVSTPAQAQDGGPKVTVMTRNLFLGGNLTPSIGAPTLPALMTANAALLSNVDRVNFPERAKLLAKEIVEDKPDLVGLQEVALWRTGALGDPAEATTVRYDYLELLMAELAKSGHPYEIAVVQNEANLEAPTGAPYYVDARLTMRDAILVRAGGKVEITDTSSGNFVNNLAFPLPSTGTTMTSTRGWTAADVRQGDRSYRFINTHLEAFHYEIRILQARELLAGAIASAGGDVILVGDMNTGPELPVADNRLAYFTLVGGGMVDTWPILHPGEPGSTAGFGDELNQPADSVEHRIDLIMFKGNVTPEKSWTFGSERQTSDGRWASDHLGHAAELRLN
ncbi:MAG: endonuclease/exonuclease/phosphatase family protein [Kineosporiaceae bacterium]|nr:endonuclease/exonuclease/phosphatase family protein [Aeromicrobium sp.]